MSSTNVVRSTGVTSEPERPVEPKMLVLSATLMVIGFVALPIAGAFHPDGPLNDHRAVFTEYARSVGWTADHVAFFAAYALTIAGLVVLFYALDLTSGMPRQLSRLGIAAAGAALALSAVRFAVDGVVLKRAVDAWIRAPDAEKPARFASAELARWIEEATVSYQSYLLAAAALLLGIVILATARIPRVIGYLLIIGGFAYLVLGWLVGENGFAAAGAVPSYAAQFAQLIWSVCLFVVAWRVRNSTTQPPSRQASV
jgi:hypothetical protein